MKTIFLLLTMGTGLSDKAEKTDDYSWVLNEMKAEATVMEDVQLAQKTINLYDLHLNVVKKYPLEKFIENELPLPALIEILESDFLFEHQGDSYYIKKS